MQPTEYHTIREINSQPEVWASSLEQLGSNAEQLAALYRDGGYTSVVFTGCGSPYYLALAAASQLQELTGIAARAVPASEIWLNPRAVLPANERALLVAISRSGETTETLRACDAYKAAGRGDVLTLCAYPGRAITTLGALNLVFPAAQEESMAQTRFFSTIFLVTTALAGIWGGQPALFDELTRLPAIGRQLLSSSHALAHRLGHDDQIDRFYFLGSGPRYGLACELSLKMKEMSLSHSEPFHFLEFRHGPKSMAGAGALVIGLVSAANQRHERAVLEEVRSLGAQTLTLAERDADVAFGSGNSEIANNLLYLPAGQLLAFERALHKGLNPDLPSNLDVFVKLDE